MGAGSVASISFLSRGCEKNCLDHPEEEGVKILMQQVGEPNLLREDHRIWRGDVNGDGVEDQISRSEKGDQFYLVVGGSHALTVIGNDVEANRNHGEIVWRHEYEGITNLHYANPHRQDESDRFFDVGDFVHYRKSRDTSAPDLSLTGFSIFFNPKRREVKVNGELSNGVTIPLDELAISPLTKNGHTFRTATLRGVIGDPLFWQFEEREIPDELSAAEDKAAMLLMGAENLMESFLGETALIRGMGNLLADVQGIRGGDGKELRMNEESRKKVGEAISSINQKLREMFKKFELNREQEKWLVREFAARYLNMSPNSFVYFLNLATPPYL